MIRLIAVFLLLMCANANSAEARYLSATIDRPPFGRVELIQPSVISPTELVIFLSGDGGWSSGTKSMARYAVDMGAAVAEVDTPRYRKNLKQTQENCHNTVADLLVLSDYIKKTLNLNQNIIPTLMGYSAGASWVYAALTEADPHVFRGGVSFGFCKDIEVDRPICQANTYRQSQNQIKGNYEIIPTPSMQHNWFDLHGELDNVCPYNEATNFIGQILAGATLISLPHVGHGFSHPVNWAPQFKAATQAIWSHE